jgi:hypothetical protein
MKLKLAALQQPPVAEGEIAGARDRVIVKVVGLIGHEIAPPDDFLSTPVIVTESPGAHRCSGSGLNDRRPGE